MSATDSEFQNPPDFYPDPDTPGQLRWWNGTRWTDERATPVVVRGLNEQADVLERIQSDVQAIAAIMKTAVVLAVLVFVVVGISLA